MSRLAGKTAVIVGGSSGFGEDIAKRFVAEGADVLIAARGAEKLEQVATALGVTQSGAKPVLVDVDPATALIDVEKVAEAISPRRRLSNSSQIVSTKAL